MREGQSGADHVATFLAKEPKLVEADITNEFQKRKKLDNTSYRVCN
jgi:hypothetical protein